MKYITLEKFMQLNNFTDKKKAKNLFLKLPLKDRNTCLLNY